MSAMGRHNYLTTCSWTKQPGSCVRPTVNFDDAQAGDERFVSSSCNLAHWFMRQNKPKNISVNQISYAVLCFLHVVDWI